MGHIQRSGTPATFDRLLASLFGAKAVDLLDSGVDGQMVIWKEGKIQSVAMSEVVKAGTTLLDPNSEYVKAAKQIGMYVGNC